MASVRAGNPNRYPLSEASLCPCLSPQSLQGCIQCVVLFPVILDGSHYTKANLTNVWPAHTICGLQLSH